MAKRMNLPETDLTESVATAEEVYKTNKEIPDLLHKTCVGGLDFGSVRDFTAVGLLFGRAMITIGKHIRLLEKII